MQDTSDYVTANLDAAKKLDWKKIAEKTVTVYNEQTHV